MSNLSEKLLGQADAAKPGSRIKQNHINAQDQKRIAVIKSAILAEGDRIRAKYPILQHQDAIGMGILLLSMVGALATGWAYLEGMLAWYITIPVIAIFLSFTHEL
ncbi:MAG TPA: fatty acid desaturase, partial [Limnobacter sp.]|nr:fatty acid desaturase [Limnobacter sp.]